MCLRCPALPVSLPKRTEEKHLEKPVLVGHSMGGGLALAVAADRSDLLKSVVVVDRKTMRNLPVSNA